MLEKIGIVVEDKSAWVGIVSRQFEKVGLTAVGFSQINLAEQFVHDNKGRVVVAAVDGNIEYEGDGQKFVDSTRVHIPLIIGIGLSHFDAHGALLR